jgi:t-SNARE complex subunit (syntaxin)
MTRQEQIKYCSICKNREFSGAHGQICGLTGLIPVIDNSCADLNVDENERARKEEAEFKYDTKSTEKIPVWTIIIIIIVVIRILMRVAKMSS